MHSRPLCIYHANCIDGFTAAWAVWLRFGDKADYLPAAYGDTPPDVTGRDVFIVDFSYKRPLLLEMAKLARTVLVLDHHKSAAADLEPNTIGNCVEVGASIDAVGLTCTMANYEGYLAAGGDIPTVNVLFDMDRSGAGIAWDFFHPDSPRPGLVNYIEDRDLWRFALPWTRAVTTHLFSFDYDFGLWNHLREELDAAPAAFASHGETLERKHKRDVAAVLKATQRTMFIGGLDVPVANAPFTMASDAGHEMALGHPFAAVYWDTAEHRHFSLRSNDQGVDVSVIAAGYGGGGHRNAAGFKVPRDHPLAQL